MDQFQSLALLRHCYSETERVTGTQNRAPYLGAKIHAMWGLDLALPQTYSITLRIHC